MADYAKGDSDAAGKEWKTAKPLYGTAMGDCDDVTLIFESLQKYEDDFWS